MAWRWWWIGVRDKGCGARANGIEAVHEVQGRRVEKVTCGWWWRGESVLEGTHVWRCLPHLLVGFGIDLSSPFFDHGPILTRQLESGTNVGHIVQVILARPKSRGSASRHD